MSRSSSARQLGRHHSGTDIAKKLKVALRCTRTGAVIQVASFLRLRAEDGSGRIDQLNNYTPGTLVLWAGEQHEVIRQ